MMKPCESAKWCVEPICCAAQPRQLLLMDALGYAVPNYFHCPLLRDEKNVRLAKRHDVLSLRTLMAQGVDPESLRQQFAAETDSRQQKVETA